jgi:glycosyltransferase involved in cell wall biosynthesis
MTTPLRVLCLDIEGGHGGSSRSLLESLRNIDRDRIEPEVWCRRSGNIEDDYQATGISCRVEAQLPKVSSLPRFSRNLIVYAKWLNDYRRARASLLSLAHEIDQRFDLVHFNHEGFWLLARWLRPRVSLPFTMHLRTNLVDTVFARCQERTIGRTMDHLVFITDNERRSFENLGGRCGGTVIFNAAPPPGEDIALHPAMPRDNSFKIASLSNFGWNRGTDQLVPIAEALARRGRRDVLFVVAGDMQLSRSLPGDLGVIGRRGGTLADYARQRKVGDMFLFLGHVDCPETVLAASDALIKPTREANPWGRDIIEALAAAKPVLTVGSWDTFVSTDETGVLQEQFDAEEMATHITRMADNRADSAAMGAAGRDRLACLCNGRDRADDLADVWCQAAKMQDPAAAP